MSIGQKLTRWGGARVSRRLRRSIPVLGTVIAAATVFADGGMFGGDASNRWRLVPTRGNNSPAFAIYQRTEGNEYQAFGLHVLGIDAGDLNQLISFIDPSLPARFGLPISLK